MSKHKPAAYGLALAFSAGLSLAVPQVVEAQVLTGAPADPQLKYSTPMPPGVASPEKVETRLCTLNFFDGFPDQASAEKLFDNLDFQRAVQSYLLALPAVNQAATRAVILSMGPVNKTVPIWEQLVDPRTVELTANDNTPYTWFWLDLKGGPLVVEVPPKVLGLVDDMWYRWVVDLDITGADKGAGGKYLFLPPAMNVPDESKNAPSGPRLLDQLLDAFVSSPTAYEPRPGMSSGSGDTPFAGVS